MSVLSFATCKMGLLYISVLGDMHPSVPEPQGLPPPCCTSECSYSFNFSGANAGADGSGSNPRGFPGLGNGTSFLFSNSSELHKGQVEV